MIVTAIGLTPSISATAARIRTGGGGITFDPPLQAKIERARGQAYLPAALRERPGERARDLRRAAAGEEEQC